MEFKPLRLLIVDDSAIIRRAISMMVENAPDIDVIGTAHDGVEALKKIRELRPDIVTLDIEMPRMGGLDVLRALGPDGDIPILVLSSLTRENARVTVEALELGAVDYLFKGDGNSTTVISLEKELLTKIKVIGTRFRRMRITSEKSVPATDRKAASTKDEPAQQNIVAAHAISLNDIAPPKLVVIGASTGGPAVLVDMFSKLGRLPAAAWLVIQHMPRMFTAMLAKRLGEVSGMPFSEAGTGSVLTPGEGLVAPGGYDLLVKPDGQIRIIENSLDSPHHPNINLTMESVAAGYRDSALGIILSGMGRDGNSGLKKIRDAGGKTWAQAPDTCVVDGMPRAAVELGAVEHIYTPEDIVRNLRHLCGSEHSSPDRL